MQYNRVRQGAVVKLDLICVGGRDAGQVVFAFPAVGDVQLAQGAVKAGEGGGHLIVGVHCVRDRDVLCALAQGGEVAWEVARPDAAVTSQGRFECVGGRIATPQDAADAFAHTRWGLWGISF